MNAPQTDIQIPNAERVTRALSDLLGISREITGPSPTPRDRLQRLAALGTALFDARRLVIEKGNPIGPEAKMLVEVLEHIEMARKHYDRERADKWQRVAVVLVPMVQQDLSEALDRTVVPADLDADGRFR